MSQIRLAEEAEMFVLKYFNGGVSPNTEKHCIKCFIAGGEYALRQLQSQLQALEAENKKLKEEKESLLEQHYKNHPNME